MGNCNGCEENNIPTVNEEALECTEFISADFVKTTKYQSYLKIGIGKSLTYVIDTIAKYIKKVNDRVDALYIYDTYVALLNQTGTTAPVATVSHNTFSSSIVWTRTSSGKYRGTLTGAFPANKTIITLGSFNKSWGEDVIAFRVDNNTIAVESGTGVDFINDGVLTNLPIDIKVYF
jgi:hypothetical protein